MFEFATSGPWSLGTLICVPIFSVIIILLIAFGVFMLREDEWGIGAGSFIVALAVLIGFLWSMYPYSAEYHQWRQADGTVDNVDSRLVSVGKGMETKYVFDFEGSDISLGCNDTRCATVEKGDHLTLSCKRVWQYTGTDGYDCNYVNLVEAK